MDARRVYRRGPIDLICPVGRGPCSADGDKEDRDGNATIRPPVEVRASDKGPDRSTVLVVVVEPGILAGQSAGNCSDGGTSREAVAGALGW